MKVFLTYNINKVYLQRKLSDADGRGGVEGFAIRIAFMRFLSGMNSLMYVRGQLSHMSNTANSLYKFSTVSLFYAFSKILSVLPIKMPQRSIFSGCRFACQAGAETNLKNFRNDLKNFTSLPGRFIS